MMSRRSRLRLVALFTLFAFVAAACGGSADNAADTGAGDDASASADSAAADVVPTTPPLDQADTNDPIPTADPCIFNPVEGCPNYDPANDPANVDPYETIVLTVNDDVQIVPVFDAPNGNEIVIYDRNEIDGIDLEYPMYAETVFGNRLTLVAEEFDDTGNWAKAVMPVRPNGTTAWVQTGFFTESRHDYHITVDLSENLVSVFKGDTELLTQVAVSGRDSRPTPIVRAYIDEMIPGASQASAYGTWILSVSAFSESLGTFGGAGAMPKIALHGTDQPELMGQYVSSGCVRIPNDVIDFIAETVPVGTPVDIVA